jgi:signal transduction histidine kinase
MLCRTNIDMESAEAFRDIVTDSRLLKDMLTLARADASSVEAVFQPVDLTAAVCTTVDKLPSFAGTGHRLSVDIGREPLCINGRHREFEPVCMDLDRRRDQVHAAGHADCGVGHQDVICAQNREV